MKTIIENLKAEIEEIKEVIKYAEEVANKPKDANRTCNLDYSKLANWLKTLLTMKQLDILHLEKVYEDDL